MIYEFWLGFKSWVSSCYHDHPVYTCLFGAGCFALGSLLG